MSCSCNKKVQGARIFDKECRRQGYRGGEQHKAQFCHVSHDFVAKINKFKLCINQRDSLEYSDQLERRV
jgi:hypothetical protein